MAETDFSSTATTCAMMPRPAASFCRQTFGTKSHRVRYINLKLFNRVCALSRLLLIIAALCSVAASEDGTNKATTIQPGGLAVEIESKGAAEVVHRLSSGSGRDWERVIHQIERGSSAWLGIAEKLLNGTDAGRTEDVHFALSLALTHNAPGVLGIVGSKLPIEKVCSVPYIEPSPAVVKRYKDEARLALGRVTSADLQARKKACLISIKAD